MDSNNRVRSGQEKIKMAELEAFGRRFAATFATRDSGRAALSKQEAAQALGVSIDYLEAHVLPDLAAVRRGARVLIPVRELERWLDSAAAKALP
jgi:hypothetical protein